MKKIAVINDISGFGRCSLTAALPIISAAGIECCPLPTAVLSNQTGYDSFYCTDYTEHLTRYIDEWKKLGVTFDAILTGYMTSEKQADIVRDFINTFKNDKTLLLVDPVMADDGIIYDTYNKSLCDKISSLAKTANVITPNLTELCILCGINYNEIISRSAEEQYINIIAEYASRLLSDTMSAVIVTGVVISDDIYTVTVKKDGVSTEKSKRFGGSYSGTGDIFAGVVCAQLVNGKKVTDAVELAVRFLEKSIADAYRERNERNGGVNFQKYLEMIISAKE